MDSIVAAAARALAKGDPLGALDRVALRDDPDALALRGIAMAQLGDLERARELLRSAARAYEDGAPLARARCVLALTEVALATRDFLAEDDALRAAVSRLEDHGDWLNAAHGRLLLARRAMLLGRIADAETELEQLHGLASVVAELGGETAVAARIDAAGWLLRAGIAVRRVRATDAARAYAQAHVAAQAAGVGALSREVALAEAELQRTVARLCTVDGLREVDLAEVEALFASPTLVADGCRRCLRSPCGLVSLSSRPVLWRLARILCEAWPGAADRDRLRSEGLQAKASNEAWRTRLRVEVGRLRRVVAPLGSVEAHEDGYRLDPLTAERTAVLLPPDDGEFAEVAALLGDGEAWSTSALALALGSSQRSVQRSLTALEGADQVRSVGAGRAKRWVARTVGESSTALLLPRFDRDG